MIYYPLFKSLNEKFYEVLEIYFTKQIKVLIFIIIRIVKEQEIRKMKIIDKRAIAEFLANHITNLSLEEIEAII